MKLFWIIIFYDINWAQLYSRGLPCLPWPNMQADQNFFTPRAKEQREGRAPVRSCKNGLAQYSGRLTCCPWPGMQAEPKMLCPEPWSNAKAWEPSHREKRLLPGIQGDGHAGPGPV